MKNINKNIILGILILLIVVALLGGFFAGIQYQKSQNPFLASLGQSGNRMFTGNGGQFMGRTGQQGTSGQRFAPVRGEVIDLSSTNFTVKLQDGTSKIVVIGGSTIFVKSQKATISDLKNGDSVMVIGAVNSDGSIKASDVSINPQQLREVIQEPSK